MMKNDLFKSLLALAISGIWLSSFLSGCGEKKLNIAPDALKPLIVTERTAHDTDDPAIWLNPADPSQSLVLGTDKDADGALVVFGLDGKIIEEKTVRNLKRPNNVDIEYGLVLGGRAVDIAVVTERLTDKLRVYSLPEMEPVDNGGIAVFQGDSLRAPMGIALYKRPTDQAIFAVVSRKDGPRDGSYLWQYRLEDDGTGKVKGTKVRAFGLYSGRKEIEAVAVDDALGYIYYSDEQCGVRKYWADPDAPGAGQELALFGTEGFTGDHEGISIYPVDDGSGYILVSDQQANAFRIFKREGELGRPHDHRLVKTISVSAVESDGSEVTNAVLNSAFPEGLFVAMSTDRTFHYYSWPDIAGKDLVIAPNGKPSGRP